MYMVQKREVLLVIQGEPVIAYKNFGQFHFMDCHMLGIVLKIPCHVFRICCRREMRFDALQTGHIKQLQIHPNGRIFSYGVICAGCKVRFQNILI
ncbi:MAG: hypothetical protein EBR54_08765 [Flavobacteriia bacterium]|nr:hypothetical protein [Flavobacteriia bacterium]